MSEEFDKQLSDHIADVFENYEGSSADAGWALLREKYPEKDKRRPFVWWWLGVAAGLLLTLGAAFWLYKGDTAKTTQASKETAKVKPLVVDTLHRKASPGTPLTGPINALESGKPDVTASAPAFSGISGKYYDNKQAEGLGTNSNINAGQGNPANEIADNNGLTQAQANGIRVTQSPVKTDTAQKQHVIASVQPSVATKTDSAAIAKKTNNLLAEKAKPAKTKGKAVAWSVFASAYNNFASNSTASSNTGGGFGADIRLSRMFALSTGLGVFQNSVGYSPTNTGLLFDLASQAPSTHYSVTDYRADMLALEMPVRVSFNISKQGNYVSAGINSAMFINETYHQTNNYFITNASAGQSGFPQTGFSYTQSQDVSTEKHFQTFAFAKSFDIAAGFGYPLGKNRMVLEPFVKIPLNTLSRPELNYGAVGASIKLTFGTGK